MRIIDDLAYCLCGGAHKCMFQIPALVASQELGVSPADIFADSGGVPNALGFVLGKAKRLEDVWFTVTAKKLYKFSYRSLFVEPVKKRRWPIIGAEAIFKSKALDEVIDKEVDFDAVLRSRIRVWVSVADLLSGETLWFSNHDEGMTTEFFRAITLGTMRIPVFWKPVSAAWKGRDYQFVDPGLITNIPVRKALEEGFSSIVVIETVPRKFSPVENLETIGETDLRYSEMNHLHESDGHLKWLGYINRNLEVLSEVEEILSDSRVPPEIREAVRLNHAEYMFSGKRPVSVCRINPPTGISVFQKTKCVSYGSPSFKARCELLGAGAVAAEEILLPFLKEQGMIPEEAELPPDWF